MCGRYTLTATAAEIIDRFLVAQLEVTHDEPKYNINPYAAIPAISNRDEMRTLESMDWGFIPHWSKDPKARRAPNARDDKLAGGYYGTALKFHRAIVPADGYYEWLAVDEGAKKPRKQGYFFHLKDKSIFSFPAIYSDWKDPATGETRRTIATITTTPNELQAPIHNRMPVILRPDEEEFWLTAAPDELPQLMSLIKPFPAEEMAVHAVSDFVNNGRNQGPACIVPLNSA